MGVVFEAISKVKQAVVYLQATFTFDMASNATPCEKLSKLKLCEVTEINAINIEGKVQRN